MLNSSEPTYIRIARTVSAPPRTVPAETESLASTGRGVREEDIALLMNVVPSIIKLLKQRVQRSLDPGASATQSDLGLPQIKVLSVLGDGECVMSDLARRFDVSGPTMTRTVDSLVERGYVQRWRDVEDRRHVFLRLTGLGQKVRLKLVDQYTSALRDFLRPLADDQLETVVLAGKHLSSLLDQHVKAMRTQSRVTGKSAIGE